MYVYFAWQARYLQLHSGNNPDQLVPSPFSAFRVALTAFSSSWHVADTETSAQLNRGEKEG